jgi:hypothetical protein
MLMHGNATEAAMLTGHEIETLRRERLAELGRVARWPRFNGELVVCITWAVLFVLNTVGGSVQALAG